ncbi:sensor histidine kinase [Roseovarius sp. B08]|uniref:sensor histidine kinase n=1 Tax=Roseovarius sp. B08 TaxID=3449223 RepID=UPI003EDC37B1
MPDDRSKLDRLRLQRSKLAEFGSFAFSSIDLDDILLEACKDALKALEHEDAKIKVLEHRPDSSDFLVRSGINWPEGVVGQETIGDDLDSPAGYALVSEGPVVSRDLSQETRFRTPSLLKRTGVRCMVNVIIAGRDAPFGVFEVDGLSPNMFDEEDVDFLRSLANLIAAAIERMRLREARERYTREQRILVEELGHRAKNLFALVQAVANQVGTDGVSAEDFKQTFIGRLGALVTAENLMFEAGYSDVSLSDVVELLLRPYQADFEERVSVDGPTVFLPSRSARMLGLALHELATNASKHGALSEPGGTVEVHWAVDDGQGQITLSWTEHDGPPVKKSERRGFGSRLLEQICPTELGGRAELSSNVGGLAYTLTFSTNN